MGIKKSFAGVANGKVLVDNTEVKRVEYTIKELKQRLSELDSLTASHIARHARTLESLAEAKAELNSLIARATSEGGLKDEE